DVYEAATRGTAKANGTRLRPHELRHPGHAANGLPHVAAAALPLGCAPARPATRMEVSPRHVDPAKIAAWPNDSASACRAGRSRRYRRWNMPPRGPASTRL